MTDAAFGGLLGSFTLALEAEGKSPVDPWSTPMMRAKAKSTAASARTRMVLQVSNSGDSG